MKRILYHGSNKIVKNPIYGYGKKYNDYGLGFYLTYDLELAKEWSTNGLNDGYVNKYEICDDNLKILNLFDKKYCILHWLTLLLKNRTFDLDFPLSIDAKEYLIKNFSININEYDVIIGYRADDSYFAMAQDFLNGTISYTYLNYALKLGNLGIQYVLISKKAFDEIKFIDYEIVNRNVWFVKRRIREVEAKKAYFSGKGYKREKNELYITNILDEEITKDDERLF